MADTTNYATLLYTSATSGSSGSFTVVAGVTKIEPPKVSAPTLSNRNHNSGKYPSKISQGIVEIDNMKLTLSYSGSALDTMYTDMVAGTTENYKIAFPNGKNWYFSGLVSSFAPASADADSPEVLSTEVEIEPTGSMLII